MKKILLFVCLFFIGRISAQTTLFQKTYGTSNEEQGLEVIETFDKGFAILSNWNGYNATCVIKTDSLGNKQWSRVYPINPVRSIMQTEDSGFVLCAVDLIKLNSSGVVTAVVGYSNHFGNFNRIKKSIDDTSYIAVCSIGNVVGVVKVDRYLRMIWGTTFTLPNPYSGPNDFLELKSDSSIYIHCSYYPASFSYLTAIAKFSKKGEGKWIKKIPISNYSGQLTVSTSSIKETKNGSILMGTCVSGGGLLDLTEVDTAGTPLNVTNYNTGDLKWDFVDQSKDNSIYTVGPGFTFTKYDSSANIIWSKKVGGLLYDHINGFTKCTNGSLVGVGTTRSFSIGNNDVFLVKIDSSGTVGCNLLGSNNSTSLYSTATSSLVISSFTTASVVTDYSSPIADFVPNDTSNDACSCVAPKAIFDTGYPNPSGVIQDYSTWATQWIWNMGDGRIDSSMYPNTNYAANGTYTVCLKVSNGCGSDSVCHPINYQAPPPFGIKEIFGTTQGTEIFPNPTTNRVTIQSSTELGTVVIYNSLGEIAYQTVSKNLQEQIDISKFPAGMYFVEAKGDRTKLIKN